MEHKNGSNIIDVRAATVIPSESATVVTAIENSLRSLETLVLMSLYAFT